MMFYDVLCLKSILGFLFSERTSGVSPVIFDPAFVIIIMGTEGEQNRIFCDTRRGAGIGHSSKLISAVCSLDK